MSVKKNGLFATSLLAGAALFGVAPSQAQQAAPAPSDAAEEVVVTGTRIQAPGVTSSSPIATIGATELQLQQQSQVERILRVLPITVPGDGENTNNGTAGVATVNLRGLGAQRNLIMIDGKRMTPYNYDGEVDVSGIPSAMLERVDIVTGGASATYGSDAISGAVNFILKRNFEGVELSGRTGRTGDVDGQTYNATLALGSNLADDRGNVALAISYAKREGITFGDRPYGTVGVSTASGAGLSVIGQSFPSPSNCGGVNTVPTTFGGSGTTLPARIIVPVTGATNFQLRDDGTVGPNCNQFNFNPYNYYQTPSERFNGVAYGHYQLTPNVEAYARFNYSSTNVRQQIAPSGIFNTPFNVPLANPYIPAAMRANLIAQYESGRTRGVLITSGANQNWFDVNNNGVVDVADTVRFAIGRRTVELGERSTTYDNNAFQMLFGFRGDLPEGWNWDLTFSHGESDRTNISAGYTNVTNVGNALNATSTTSCLTGGSSCVPINLFGPQGTITPAMAAYAGAVGIEQQSYTQTYGQASISGPAAFLKSPFASEPTSVAFGYEYREEVGSTSPDECLKLAPSSCLGGAGGNTLPITGGFSARELYTEILTPLASDMPGFKELSLELGYRYADYDPSGINRTWKAGLNWQIGDDLRVRVMRQRAARAPNVGELAAPLTSGLANATRDPCSVANPAALTDARLRALCISTGMAAADVGRTPDIVAGQINTFNGTNLSRLPKPELADTTTYGFVYRPSFLSGVLNSPSISVDYWDIEIEGYIGQLGAQEILDLCYVQGNPAFCGQIVRQAGNLIFPGSGVQRFTQNLSYAKAQGIDLNVNFGIDLEKLGAPASAGSLSFAYNATFNQKNESLSSAASSVIDCQGFYGNQCGNPTPDYKHVARATYEVGPVQLSTLWRRIGETAVEPVQTSATFAQFRKIDAFNYFDFTGTWSINEHFEVSGSVQNLTNEDPPIVGGDIGTTASNGGNTFPQTYDSVGRVFQIGGRMKF